MESRAFKLDAQTAYRKGGRVAAADFEGEGKPVSGWRCSLLTVTASLFLLMATWTNTPTRLGDMTVSTQNLQLSPNLKRAQRCSQKYSETAKRSPMLVTVALGVVDLQKRSPALTAAYALISEETNNLATNLIVPLSLVSGKLWSNACSITLCIDPRFLRTAMTMNSVLARKITAGDAAPRSFSPAVLSDSPTIEACFVYRARAHPLDSSMTASTKRLARSFSPPATSAVASPSSFSILSLVVAEHNNLVSD